MRPSLKRLPAVHSTWCRNRKVSYCAKHTRTNNCVFICHACEIFVYLFIYFLCGREGKWGEKNKTTQKLEDTVNMERLLVLCSPRAVSAHTSACCE